MLRGLDNITSIIQEFLDPFELTAVPDTDFFYQYVTDEVHFSLVELDEAGKAFLANAEARFPNVKAPLFLWSLVHEIGHAETYDLLTDEEERYCRDEKAALNSKDYERYFNCPDEWAATDWAGKYLESHSREVSHFWNKLVPAIEYFYQVNKVEV